ncbi:MAG: ABC transporter ATP-binding protein [Clostridiales bacterium]|nr:ABC transporter ATP-binding protein [Clostridiales bacterium]
MNLMIRYLRPFAGRMGVGLTIKVFGTLIELALPYILSHILKNIVYFERVAPIVMWGCIMIFIAALACTCNIIANRMASRVARDFSRNMRHDLFKRAMTLSSAQTDAFTIPSLEARITTDTYNVHNFVGVMQRMGVRAPILLIGGVAITLMMDSFLALVMISVLPFIFIVVYVISIKGIPLYTKVQRATDNMIRVVREDTQGIRVVKALSKTQYEHRRYDKTNTSLVSHEKKANIVMGMVNPFMTFLMNFGIVAVVALSANRVALGQSDPENVIAFMQYFTLISMAMMSVTRIFVMYTKSSASAKRIEEVIDTPCDILEHTQEEYPCIDTDDHITFKDVSFAYPGTIKTVTDIDFGIKKGSSLGIIGVTGSGKSTLIRLLLRFYDVNKGGIYINSRDIRTLSHTELHKTIGTAMQNDFLYADTIYENIDFGRHLPPDQIFKAAKIAQAHDFITAFPDGYAHPLSQKGTNISGGQKQRILIARAIAGNPQILILDDSSSALDYKTDASLRSALKENMAGTTTLTVAQRVSSVMNCDKIIVMDNGKIIAMGTHNELMQGCEEYIEISNSQIGGAFVD